MEYKLIEAASPYELERQVNLYLKDGWKLRGKLKIIREGTYTSYTVFYQQLIKED